VLFVTARATGGASFGSQPGVAPRVAASIGVRFGRFAARSGVAFAAETSEPSTVLPSAGGALWLFAIETRACGSFLRAGRLDLAGCAGADVALLAARGYGVTAPARAETWSLAPAIGFEPAFLLADRFRIVLPLELSFPLDRPTFTIDGLGPIFRPSPVSGRVSLGLELDF
jgi:hypothetical protein